MRGLTPVRKIEKAVMLKAENMLASDALQCGLVKRCPICRIIHPGVRSKFCNQCRAVDPTARRME